MASNQLLFLLNKRQSEIEEGLQTTHESAYIAQRRDPSKSAPSRRTSIGIVKRQVATSSQAQRHRAAKAPIDYVSPFIRKANELAKERSKEAIKKIRSNRAVSGNEFMEFRVSSELFDPSIKKQEIFKLEPRNRPPMSAQASASAPALSSHKRYSTSMTKRTQGDSPSVVPSHRRTHEVGVGELPPPPPVPPSAPPSATSTGMNHPTPAYPSPQPLSQFQPPGMPPAQFPPPGVPPAQFPPPGVPPSRETRSTSPMDQRVVQQLVGLERPRTHHRKDRPHRSGSGSSVSAYSELVSGLGAMMSAVGAMVKDMHNKQRPRRYLPPQLTGSPPLHLPSQLTGSPPLHMATEETRQEAVQPLSRAHVLDAMLHKLQGISECEDEVLAYMRARESGDSLAREAKDSLADSTHAATALATALPRPARPAPLTHTSIEPTHLQSTFVHTEGSSRSIGGHVLSKMTSLDFMRTPSVKQTHETANMHSGEVMEAYDKIYTQELPRSRVTKQDDTTEQILTRERHPDYPILRPSVGLTHEMGAYKRELKLCRELRETAFRCRGVRLDEVVTRIADEIVRSAVDDVAGELEEFFDEYSEKLLEKI